MRATNRLRIRFGTRTLFALITLSAWCAWQWSISRQRQETISELERNHCYVCDNSTVERQSIEAICSDMFFQGRLPPASRRSTLGAISGIDNYREITVFTSSLTFSRPTENYDAILTALSRLSGVTTFVIRDTGPEIGKRPEAIEFKRRLHELNPRIKVQHVHLHFDVG